METDVSDKRYLLKSGKKIHIISSLHGHYPLSNGKNLMDKIISYKPEFVLIEDHPQDMQSMEDIEHIRKRKVALTKTDVDWALSGAEKIQARPVLFDIPQKLFHKKLYELYLNFSDDLAMVHYVSYQVVNILWHYREKNKLIIWRKIFSKAKKRILKFGPMDIKMSLKNNTINKTFSIWLKITGYSKEEIATLPISHLRGLRYFVFLFALSSQRDNYMIKVVERYAAKGRVVVVVGAGHLRTWLKKKWIRRM